MKKELINTEAAPQPIGPYSQAVKISGDLMFISGQIALDKDGILHDRNIKKETELVLENILAILVSQGLSLNNIVKITVLMTDIEDFDKMNEVYEKYFKEFKPARAAFEVTKLPKNANIEIEAIAVC